MAAHIILTDLDSQRQEHLNIQNVQGFSGHRNHNIFWKRLSDYDITHKIMMMELYDRVTDKCGIIITKLTVTSLVTIIIYSTLVRQLSLYCLVDELRQGCFVPRRREKNKNKNLHFDSGRREK